MTEGEEINMEPEQKKESLFGIRILKSTPLRVNRFTLHPIVQVSFADTETLRVLQSSSKPNVDGDGASDQGVDKDMAYVLPKKTKPYQFRGHGTTIAQWNETLLFKESYDTFSSENAVILFELLDASDGVSIFDEQELEDDPLARKLKSRLAWGFLKLSDALEHTGKPKLSKFRIQLYEYNEGVAKRSPCDFDASENAHMGVPCAAFFQFVRNSRHKYPAHLVISFVAESGNTSILDLETVHRDRISSAGGALPGAALINKASYPWKRLPGNRCGLPDSELHRFDTGDDGCMDVKFSPCGFYLACACGTGTSSAIRVFDVISGVLVATLTGHIDIIYSVRWAPDSSMIVSASEDGTVRIWPFPEGLAPTLGVPVTERPPALVLHHPCFMYCALVHPSKNVVITGGYDGIVRIWDIGNGDLKSTMQGHVGAINAMEMDKKGARLFTGDSRGVLKLWSCEVNDDGVTPAGNNYSYAVVRTVNESDSAIVSLHLHPLQRRLLALYRDGILRAIDVSRGAVMYKYGPVMCEHILVHARFSPCGNYIVSGSEDGRVYVYNCGDTHDLAAVLADPSVVDSAMVSVDWNVKDDFLATSPFGLRGPILIYMHTRSSSPRSSPERKIASEAPSVMAATKPPRPPRADITAPMTMTLNLTRRDSLGNAAMLAAGSHDIDDESTVTPTVQSTLTIMPASQATSLRETPRIPVSMGDGGGAGGEDPQLVASRERRRQILTRTMRLTRVAKAFSTPTPDVEK